MTSDRRRLRSLGRNGCAAVVALAVAVTPALARNPLKLPGSQYEPVAWAQIEGWADDDHDEAFATFLKSCKAILQGSPSRDGQPMVGALYNVCNKAVALDPEKPGEARLFFEQNFRPVRIAPLGTPDGFVTGYYEPIVEGTREHVDGYDNPLYRKPSNLLPGGRMAVMSAAAADDGKKKKKHSKRRLVPFYDRASIEDGALAGRNLEICWVKDPIDSFFAQIQGSVRVLLDDGKMMRLNYDAANGHPYYAVGRDLIARNIIPKDEMSMDRIREWMMRHPAEGDALRRKNRSYVFFHETKLSANDEPIGAEGIPLTPGRSIAVDHKLHTYGTPFFISGYLPIESLKPDTWFRRLMIAQDTGGAIVGPARADLYFGAGADAESVAGRLRHNARFVMLLPKELLPSAVDEEIPLPRPRPEMLEVPVASVPAEPAPASTATITPKAAPAAVAVAPAKPAVAAKPVAAKASDKSITAKPIPAAAEKKTTAKPAVAKAGDKTKTAKAIPTAPAKKIEEKPAAKSAKTVAAKSDEAMHDGKAAAQPAKKSERHKKADAKKAETSTEAWEDRVMPKIKSGPPEKKTKPKKKG